MFSKYKKGGAKPEGTPKLTTIDGGADAAAAEPARVLRKPAQADAMSGSRPLDEKERKRKERLSEIKVELHKRLLDNLNLAALDGANENDLRNEITAITAEALKSWASF